jgi:LPXTG-motif cell wall-anchored protein
VTKNAPNTSGHGGRHFPGVLNSTMVGHLAGAALTVGGLFGLAAVTAHQVQAVDADESTIEEYVTWSPVCVEGDEQLLFVVQQNKVGLALTLADTDVVFFGLEQEITYDPSLDSGDVRLLNNSQISPGFYDISEACKDEPSTPEDGEPVPGDPESNENESNEHESDEHDSNEHESANPGELPATGPSSSVWIALGGGLALSSGAGMIAATRRRA